MITYGVFKYRTEDEWGSEAPKVPDFPISDFERNFIGGLLEGASRQSKFRVILPKKPSVFLSYAAPCDETESFETVGFTIIRVQPDPSRDHYFETLIALSSYEDTKAYAEAREAYLNGDS